MENLNDRVKPAIVIIGHKTTSAGKYSWNEYLDPEDKVPFYKEDLTPQERGHFYLWKKTREDRVLVYTPYRIMDVEAASAFKGLRSYLSVAPYITSWLPRKLLKKPSTALQNFSLSQEDFDTFVGIAEQNSWVLEKDEVDCGNLRSEVSSLVVVVDGLIERVTDHREKHCSLRSTEKIDTDDKLSDVLKTFSSMRRGVQEVKEERVRLVKVLDRLKEEVDRRTDIVLAESAFDKLSSAIASMNQLNFDRFEREAVHKHMVCTGQSEDKIPSFIRPLAEELEELSSYYKSLRFIKGEGTETVVDLPGIKIRFTEDEIRVEGDMAALKPYVSGTAVKGSKSRSKRFSAIFTDEDEK